MMLHQGTGEDMLVSVADQWGPCDLSTLSQRANLAETEILERIKTLIDNGEIISLGELGNESDAVVYSKQGWDILQGKASIALQTYHTQYPLRVGAPIPEIRSRLNLTQGIYLKALARLSADGIVVEEGQSIRLPNHTSELTPELEEKATSYIRTLEESPYSPPTDIPLDNELLNALIGQGKVVKVNESVVFSASAYKSMTAQIIEHLNSNGSITVAEARTIFDSSRKYILPLMEHLDQQRITRRQGDERVLR